MRITVASLKGGTGKTTTAAHIAAGLHRTFGSVVAVDADRQGSLLHWAETAVWPWLTVSLPTKTIHEQIGRLVADAAGCAVIDTPPGDLGVVASAMRAADLVLIPIQPTTADLDRMSETLSLAADVCAVTDAPVKVLLTRVVPRTRARSLTRQALTDGGFHVLNAEVRQSQAMALSHGSPLSALGDYEAVLSELIEP